MRKMKWGLLLFMAQLAMLASHAAEHAFPAVEFYCWRDGAWLNTGQKYVRPAYDFTSNLVLDNGQTIVLRFAINDDGNSVTLVTGGASVVDENNEKTGAFIINSGATTDFYTSTEMSGGAPFEANRLTQEETGMSSGYLSVSEFENLVVPSSVTDDAGKEYTVTVIGSHSIGGGMFESVGKAITLPETIITIEAYAGSYNTKETSPQLLDLSRCTQLEAIGHGAFWGCKSLETLNLSNCLKLKLIDEVAFHSCTAMSAILGLSDCTSLEVIDNEAFEYCSSLLSVDFTKCSSLQRIGKGAFAICSALKTVKLTDCSALQTIDYQAFYQCKALATLEDLTDCAALQTIGAAAFYQCSSLLAVDFSSSNLLQEIGAYAFYGCTALSSVDFTDCTLLEKINESTFRQCSSLATLDLSPCVNLAVIDKNAFRQSGLEEMNLLWNRNLTTLGNAAFGVCASLKKVILPESMTTTQGGAFASCTKMEELYITSKMTDSANSATNFNGFPSSCAIYVPMQYMDYYRATENYYAGTDGANVKLMYPILQEGKYYRTFSYDKALDFTTISGLYDESEELEAVYASAVDIEEKVVTFTPAGELAAYEGVMIVGTGTEGEFYPIKKAAGSPVAMGDTENYLEGNGENTLSFEDKKPVDGKQRYFIMQNGDFYWCSGGTLARWKSYLDIREPVKVYSSDNSGAKMFSFVFETGQTSGISQETRRPRSAANYSLEGICMGGKTPRKGIYIRNGRKEVVK